MNPEQFGFTDTGKSLIKEIDGRRYTFTSIKKMDEFNESITLQKRVWGLPDLEVCPPHEWMTAIDTGGHVLDVRNENNELVAFIVGFGGYDTQKKLPFIFSDMAAVTESLRDANIGFTLKLAQAIHVSNQGIPEIRWTYDPLRSRNAYLNLHKLGAIAENFYINKYGNSLAGTQNADTTDRFLVRWSILDVTTQNIMINQRPLTSIDGINIAKSDKLLSDNVIAIEIPADIDSLAPDQKIYQQLKFRELASTYITELGYKGVDYTTTNNRTRGIYIFQKK